MSVRSPLLQPRKPFGRDADDRVGMQVELDRFADDARIAGEVVLPQAVAENRDGRAGALVGACRYQGAAQVRLDAQHLEIIRGRQRAIDALRLG